MSGAFLKQSTAAQSRSIGPFVDDTDFKTAETGLTIANTDIKLIVNGGASADKNSGGGTHRVNGMYGVTFDATDTATVGEMEVSVKVAGALPVFKTFTVLEEAVYDALYAASAPGYVANAPVNVAQISGDGTAADNAESFFDGTGYAGTNNVIPTVTTTTNLTNEHGKYAGGAVWIGPTANTNTVSYTDGIITNPVSTIAAAKTIADALGLRRFYTVRTGSTQISAAMVGYDFDGSVWSLTTTGGSRDVGTSSFHYATLSGGTFAGTSGSIWWEQCEFPVAVSVGLSNMWRCSFGSTLTLSEAGAYDFIDCASIVAGTSAPVFAVPAGTVNVSFRRWSGGIRITGITTGTTISIDMVSGGTVTLEGADGTVVVRGMATGVTDSRTGTPSLTQTAVVNQTSIADAVWDEATAGHTTAGTTGKALTDAGSAGDPWSTALPGAYGAGTAGSLLGRVPDIAAGAAGGLFIAGTNAATTVAITGNITGNLSGSVGSVTGAVGSVTGNVGGNVAGSVASVTAGVTVTTNNDKTGYRLSATGVDDVLDEVVEGSYTVRQYMRGFAAAMLGLASGLETTNAKYRDTGDTKDRIDATVDVDGNRTAVTLDLT